MKHLIANLRLNRKSWLTVAMINIPLSISLAVASWATPLQWLLTWIWWWIIAALFASSNYNIFWVAGALSSILLAFALTNWPEYLPIVAIISGIVILCVYLLKISRYITLIPSTALHGFLVWVWITIAMWQLNSALWLQLIQHKEFYMNLYETFLHIPDTNIIALGIFALWFGFLLFCKKKFPAFPSIIVLTWIWIWIWYMSKYGIIPSVPLLADKYPQLSFAFYQFSWIGNNIHSFKDFVELLKMAIGTSVVVAIIAILETLISWKVAEKQKKERFDRNKEVLWLWLSNLGSGLLGWLPSTAVFVRTALNIKSWATHRTSAFLTALFTLIICAVAFNGLFVYLPFCIIAAILMNTAFGLIDVNLLKKLYGIEQLAFWIALLTAFFTVVEDPTIWIIAWTAITLIVYIKRLTQNDANISVFKQDGSVEKLKLTSYIDSQSSSDTLLIKFSGGLNYMNIEHNISLIEKLNQNQNVIISFSHMWDVDVDWIEAIEEMIETLGRNWVNVYVTGVKDDKRSVFEHFHAYRELMKQWHIFESSTIALEKILRK